MNKLKQRKSIYPQARRVPMCSNQTQETSQICQRESLKKTMSMAIAYNSLLRISETFNIPVVEKTLGKGIVRVSCRTILQLDNIALIMKELVKFSLIKEIGMEPLAYSNQMDSLVLFLKPTCVASSQKLDLVFRKYSLTPFEYQHLMLDIENIAHTDKYFKSKRIAVKIAHSSLCQILKEFNIPCVEQKLGSGYVRVCCRSILQLDNIPLIIKELIKTHLIKEIGMPLEYSYKMKSLVLFLKPPDIESSIKIVKKLQKCSIKYSYLVNGMKYPGTPIFQEHANSSRKSIVKIAIYVVIILILYEYFRV